MRLCVVVPELFPVHDSEEGRVLHALVQHAVSSGADVHVLLASPPADAKEVLSNAFGPRVTLHAVDLRATPDAAWSRRHPQRSAFGDAHAHADSLRLMLAVTTLARSGLVFDRLEFADRLGWAYACAQEQALGDALARTTIAIRLCGTRGLEEHFAPMRLYPGKFAHFELERKALQMADLVLAPNAETADLYEAFYGFDRSWRTRVREESVVTAPPALRAPDPGPLSLLFPSPLRPSRRPDLFVRAAVTLMRTTDLVDVAVLPGRDETPADRDALAGLVPEDLRDRFHFRRPDPAIARNAVAVFPSECELWGFEASRAARAGATIVVSRTAPAFAAKRPFRAGVNCHKFDGTLAGLVQTLREVSTHPGAAATDVSSPTVASPLWDVRPPTTPPARPRTAPPLVSVLVTNFNLGTYLPTALASVAASTHPRLEVILVDDASTDEADRALVARLVADPPSIGGRPLRVVRNTMNLGLAATRNVALAHATGDYVVPLDADDAISTTFIDTAVAALERRPAYDVVVPTAAYFGSDDDLRAERWIDYAVFLGDVPSLGLIENRFACATTLMRRSLFDRFPYDERLPAYEDWDLYLRLALAGCRFLVTNDVHFFYRLRPHSMVRQVTLAQRFELIAAIHAALPGRLPAVSLASIMSAPHDLAVENARLQRRIEELTATLDAVHGSHTWRLVEAYRYVMDHSRAGPLLRPLRDLVRARRAPPVER